MTLRRWLPDALVALGCAAFVWLLITVPDEMGGWVVMLFGLVFLCAWRLSKKDGPYVMLGGGLLMAALGSTVVALIVLGTAVIATLVRMFLMRRIAVSGEPPAYSGEV